MISKDSLTMLMLCSRLGLEQNTALKPLSLREWNKLARNIQTSALKRPGRLLGVSSDDLMIELDIEQTEAERIAYLIDRSGSISIELERLESVGIQIITRSDDDYPERYRTRLRESAPPILFCAGETALLGQRGIAIVGSRDVDLQGEKCAEWIGNACGHSGMVLYSGGAKGVDSISMAFSLEARGFSVGVIANNMDRSLRIPEYRNALIQENLCLITPYLPSASFNVGLAMGRNKLIYTLADYAVVVSSSANKGGTWSGATENLKNEWVPLFVVEYEDMPEGNCLLIDQGGIPLPLSDIENYLGFEEYLAKHVNQKRDKPTQLSLL